MQTSFSDKATNRVDGKGRVSIPAPYRKVLAEDGDAVLHLMPDIMDKPLIMGFGAGYYRTLTDSVRKLPPFHPVTEALSAQLGGEVKTLPLDETGRIVLPAELRAVAGIGEDALFVGMITHFQIWRPETYAEVSAERKRIAMENIHTLPWGGA